MSEDNISMEDLTEEQQLIVNLFSRLVGKRLTHIEATFSDKTQRDSFKKMAEGDIYDIRNELLKGIWRLSNGQ